MKIYELVEFVGNSKNKMLKADQLEQVIAKEIEVKKYLGIKEKKDLVDDIISECILYSDGMFKFDEIEKYICFTMKTIAAYTNLELSDDIEDDYDGLCRAGLLNVVINTFSGEYENVKLLLQMKTDYILSGNSIEAQFGKFLDELAEKIKLAIDVVANKVEGFDISKLPISMDDIGALISFLRKK